MRYYLIGLALVSGPGFAFCACGTAPPSPLGSGGAGGGVDCHDVYLFGDPCDACLADKCCADLFACGVGLNCPYCTSEETAETCTKEPQRSLAIAIHECGWGPCKEECAVYGRSLGPDPNDPVSKFCSTVGPVYCEALFACCGRTKVLEGIGGTVEGCKALMSGPHCLREYENLDDSYGIDNMLENNRRYGLRRRMKDGQTILDQAQLDACVAGLAPMAAGGAACVAPVDDFFIIKCLTAFKGQLPHGDACNWYSEQQPALRYAFIPCKEGRCEDGKCVPFLKVGDTCDPVAGMTKPGVCDYLHDEACDVRVDTDTWACGPRKEIGQACDPFMAWPECKSGTCDANHTCAPVTPMNGCGPHA